MIWSHQLLEPLDITALVLTAHKPIPVDSDSERQDKLIAAILECPLAQTTRKVADCLQMHGYAVVDDLFPPEAHAEISRETQEIIAREKDAKGFKIFIFSSQVFWNATNNSQVLIWQELLRNLDPTWQL